MNIDKNTAVELYRKMLMIRLAEEKVIQIYPSDKIQSPVHLSIGQEAVAVGVCQAMHPEDRIYGTYRSHALYAAKSGDLKGMFAELYARDSGCARGKGGSMHLVAPEHGLMGCSAVVASTIPVATGHALASQLSGRKYVVVAFFGDGAVDEGVFFESINFALLKNLPILYLVENNFYAIHSKVEDRRIQTDIYRIGEGLGVKGERHDGLDVFTAYSETRKALDAIRAGGEPRILELTTRRWKEHVGINDDFGENYRLPDEQHFIFKNDSIRKAETVLRKEHGAADADFAKIRKEVEKKIEEAVDYAEKSPFPALSRLSEDVFAHEHKTR